MRRSCSALATRGCVSDRRVWLSIRALAVRLSLRRASSMGTAVVVAVIAAQSVADALFARLEGRWTGEGTVLSRPATLQMEWAWTLDQQFLELRFHNEMGGSTPT